jgi:hypothetical protein
MVDGPENQEEEEEPGIPFDEEVSVASGIY